MYYIENMPSQIDIGFTGELMFRKVEIDMSAWMADMPEGVPSIVHIRPEETTEDAYIVATTFENNILTWEITNADLGSVEGVGTAQIWLEEEANESVVKRGKSILVATMIHQAINNASEEVPAVQAAFMEQMTALKVATVNAAETAKNVSSHAPKIDEGTGNWLVWDQYLGQYVDTGLSSRGQIGAKSFTFVLDDVENVSGAYLHTTTLSAVTATMKPIALEVGTPSVFGDFITVTCDTGAIALSCPSVSGSSTVRVIVEETAQSPYEMFLTSEEYATLIGKIGTLANLETETKTDVVAAINELVDRGIDPTAIIDDTAGDGDTNKVWSADKLTDTVSSLNESISAKYTKPSGGIPSTDLADSYIEAEEENLLRSEMPGTSTTVTKDSNGRPTSIVHTANSETIRTDTFVWSTGSVTETRTLANGKYLTITTNLDTLAQTISEVQEVA